MTETSEQSEIEAATPAETGSVEPPPQEHTHEPGPTMHPELRREIAVEASADEVSRSFDKVVKRYQKLARIPGFRAGKVPGSLIRSKFAKEVRQEVLESLVSERFRAAIDEQQLRPVSEPQLVNMQLNEGEPLHFTAAFEVMPAIDVTGYESIRVPRPDSTLTDDEYAAELSRVLESYATIETVEDDRPLQDGDWAEIEFQGEVRDLAQTVGEESAAEQEPIRGDHVLIEIGGKDTLPAFTEGLRGARAGQELKLEVDYPAEFGEAKLAGKTVSYDVTVRAIKRKTFPERDADLAKQLGSFDTFEQFEANLRERAAARKSEALENQRRDRILGEMITRFPFPVPESFVQQQIEARLDRGLRALAQQGMKAEDMRKLDFGRLRTAQREQALNEVKASMLLDRIADLENVEINGDDVERELLMLSLQHREPLDSLRDRLEKDGSLQRIREQMRRERAGALLSERLAS